MLKPFKRNDRAQARDDFREQYVLFLRSRVGINPNFTFEELLDFWGIDGIDEVETFSIEVDSGTCLWQSSIDFIKSSLLALDVGVQQVFNVSHVPTTGVKPVRWHVWLRVGRSHRDMFKAWQSSTQEQAKAADREQAKIARLMLELKELRRANKPKRSKAK